MLSNGKEYMDASGCRYLIPFLYGLRFLLKPTFWLVRKPFGWLGRHMIGMPMPFTSYATLSKPQSLVGWACRPEVPTPLTSYVLGNLLLNCSYIYTYYVSALTLSCTALPTYLLNGRLGNT